MNALQTQTVNLAIGRIFLLASRPEQAGDIADYERCRSIILNALDPDMQTHRAVMASTHNVARDRGKGAAGQW